MGNDYYTYCWLNTTNGKRYVGKGKGNRWSCHLKPNGKSLFSRALKKYGEDTFILTFLAEDVCEQEAFFWEIFFIAFFNTNIRRGGHGYNHTDGGEGTAGLKQSEEHRRKISEALKGKIVPEETKRKMSKNNASKRPEVRRKLSEALKGKIVPEETRRKLSEVAKNRKPVSEETRRKISEAIRRHHQRLREEEVVECGEISMKRIPIERCTNQAPFEGYREHDRETEKEKCDCEATCGVLS